MPGSSSITRIFAMPLLSIFGQRQHNGERAADAWLTLQTDLSAHGFGYLLHHGEADPCSLDSRALGRMAANEFLKNRLLFIGVDTHALIAHGDQHLMVLDQ